jgi:glucosamine--fructose-6-phosphate aminotransferase (isomerizing)
MSAVGNAETLMRAEIAEQPEAIARTLDALLPLTGALRTLAADRRHVAFVARGSSDTAAVYGRYLSELHAGRTGRLASPSVATLYGRRLDLDDTLVVCLSQSGATEEIVTTLHWARACGARTVAVTNVAGSPLADAADVALVTQAGTERAVPATKTYTCQLAALAVLGAALGPQDGRLADELVRAPGEIDRLLADPGDIDAAADAFAASSRVVVSGRGYTLSTALELSLKLLETCYLPSLGLSQADLLHGPIAVVDDATAALVVAPPGGPMLPGLRELAHRLGGRAHGVTGLGGDAAFAAACGPLLRGPALPEALAPIALAVPGQLLVETLARRLGLDPDAPRGLRKVTQTDTDPALRSTTTPHPDIDGAASSRKEL